eukprot:403352238
MASQDQKLINFDNLDQIEQLAEQYDEDGNLIVDAQNQDDQLLDNNHIQEREDEEEEGKQDSLEFQELKAYKQLVRRLGLREKEIHDTFVINEDKIQALMSDQDKMTLKASDLIVFKDKADDIIGIELDSYIQFLINDPTQKKKSRRVFTYKHIKQQFMKWLEWSYQERNKDPIQEQHIQKIDQEIQNEEKAKKLQQEEKFNWRKRMTGEILSFKLDKHKERFVEIFKRYNSGNKQESNTQQNQTISIPQVNQLFSDIAYIAGVVFCRYNEFEQTQEYTGQKDSSKAFIRKFKRYLWNFIHQQQIQNRLQTQKKILRQLSPDGYYDQRSQNEKKVYFDDELFKLEKSQTFFDFPIFKKVLKEFIQNKSVVAVDLNSEYTKYLKKKEKEQGNKDVRLNLQRTIQEYENLIKTAEDEQQRQRLEKLIDQMRKELQNIGSVANKTIASIESQSLLGQQKIFNLENSHDNFDSSLKNNNFEDEKENINQSKRDKGLQFEQYEDLSSRIRIGDFLKFCKDFELNKSLGLKKELITSIFHKAGHCHKPILFDEFLVALRIIGEEINRQQILINEKELKEVELSITQTQSEVTDREQEHVKFLSYKKDTNNPHKKFSEEEKKEYKRKDRELQGKKDQLVKELKNLRAKTVEQTTDELYRYMELDNSQAYQKKLKGFHMPFFMHDKYERIPEDDPGKRYKIRFKKIPFSDVKKVVQEIRDKREKDKNEKTMEQNEQYLRKMKFIQKTHDRLRHEKLKKIVEERKILESQGMNPNQAGQKQRSISPAPQKQGAAYSQQFANPFSYLEIKNTKQGQPLNEGRNLKVTLDILTKMHYQDFNSAGDKKQQFNPLDLVQAKQDQDEVARLIMNDSQNYGHSGDEEYEVDEFTRKRLPRPEDFKSPPQIQDEKVVKQKKQLKKTVPQNHLKLADSYDFASPQHNGSKNYLTQARKGNHHLANSVMMLPNSKSVAQLQPLSVKNQHYPKGQNNSLLLNQSQQHQIPAAQLLNPKHASALGRYEGQIPKQQMQQMQQVMPNKHQTLARNASQGTILKASQLDLQNKNKMDGIMRMHDRQIQKGMNVLKR